jgi:hypothetical protein
MELRDIWPSLGSGVESGALKQPSTTKRGPGRKHHAGHKKASPIKAKGAGVGFVQHTVAIDKRVRRERVAKFGRRQTLKQVKELRRLSKQVRAEAA